jgi:hypothetical protein
MSISPIRLARGTKEFVNADVTDETGAVSTLVGTSPNFTVKDDTGATVQGPTSCAVTGMTLQALIDTTSGYHAAPDNHYNLYFSWTIGSEVPVEGPFDIYLT